MSINTIVAGVVIYLVYDTVSDWYHYLDESIDDIDKNQECLGANDYLDNYEKDYRKRVNNQLNRSRNIGKETTNDVLKAGYPLGKALDAAEGITYEFSK